MTKKHSRIVSTNGGDPCPRCNGPTEIHEHAGPLTAKHDAQPFHYSRWFVCNNPICRTTVIMPEKFRVWHGNDAAKRYQEQQERWRQQRHSDVVLDVLDE